MTSKRIVTGNDGPVREVKADKLEGFTENGWVLIDTFEIETPSWAYEHQVWGCSHIGHAPRGYDHHNGTGQAYTPYDTYRGNDKIPTVPDTTPYFVIKERRYLLGKSRDTYVLELIEKAKEAHKLEQATRREWHEKVDEITKVRKAIEKLEAERDDALRVADLVREAKEKMRAELNAAHASLRRLEERLGAG